MTNEEVEGALARAAELISGGWTNEDGADAIGALEEVAPEHIGDAVSALYETLHDRFPDLDYYHLEKSEAIRTWNSWPESTREEVVVLLMEAEALVAGALADSGGAC